MGRRGDERNTLFARMAWPVDSFAYKDYYERNPHLKEIDDELRALPQLCSEGTATYDSINAPIADATFAFLSDIRHLAEGKPAAEKRQVEAAVMSRRIKGLANLYGAISCSITPMKEEFYYSHRGRWLENYGEEVTEAFPYAIVFAVKMDNELIDRAPQLAEVIETSHGYVKGAIVGMILAYYIRSLGYEARNHMDANYLVSTKLIAEAAGLGEMGRSGLLITPENGPCVRLGVVTTTLPLVVDEPQTFGIEEFCKICDRCANSCPGQAITKPKKNEIDDSDNWTFDGLACYRVWRHVGTDCGICISSCPFAHGLEVAKVQAAANDYAELRRILAEFEGVHGKNRPYIKDAPNWLK